MRIKTFCFILLLPLLMAKTCPPFNPAKTAFIGDSITWGAGSGAGFDPQIHSFFAILDADPSLDNHELHNFGCGGASTYDWVDYASITTCGNSAFDLLEILYDPNKPFFYTYVILGTNDSVGFFNPSGIVTKAEYKANLISLVNRIAGSSFYISLVTPPPHPTDPVINARLSEYVDAINEVCQEVPVPYDLKCGVIDLFHPLDASDFTNDIHPNAQGHAKIADLFLADLTGN